MFPKCPSRNLVLLLSRLTLILLLASCTLSPSSPLPHRPKIPACFEGSFQGENLAGWDTKRHLGSRKYLNDPGHYSFQLVEDKWSDDKLAGRFEIRNTDRIISGGWRAEFKDKYTALPGDRISYSFEFLLPKDFVTRDKSIVIAQWHDKKVGGVPCQRPTLTIRVVCGCLHIYLWNDLAWQISCARGACGDGAGILLGSLSVEKERWNKIELEALWSPGNDGQLDIRLNGEPAATYKGGNTYAGDIYGPYFKLGIYTVHPFEDPIVVYYKKYRRQILGTPSESENQELKQESPVEGKKAA